MPIRPIRASRRWFALIAVAAVPLMLSGLYSAAPGNAASAVPAGVRSAAARTGHIAAGTLVTERTVIPPGSLVMGAPARVKRSLTEPDRASIADYAKRYVQYKNVYRGEAASE